DRLLAGDAGELLIELELEAGEPVVVDACVAQHLRGDGRLRIRAPLLAVEVEPGQLALGEQACRVRRRLALDVPEVRAARRQRVQHGAALEPEDARGRRRL